MIPIYEFNRLIWNIIRNQPVPFIYERTSERFDHFLIDEFQDTSSLQWLNLLPLIENSLSQGGMSMVVGDAKQAIYRWRNGDVWQFVRLPEVENKDGNPLLAARADALKRYAEEGFLRANFRSAPEIIRFNNDFFSWLRDQHPETLGAIYRDSDQVTGRQDAVGYVELHMVPWEKELRQADYSEAVASAVLEKVRRVLGQPGTTFTPSDICILVRTNAEAGVVATKLIEGEIDVVSDDSFPLGSFPEPLMIKALVGLLVDRQSTLHGAVVLTQLYRGGRISHDSLHLFLTGMASGKSAGGAALWHEVDKWFAAAGVERSMYDYLSLPLYECCEQVIRDFFGTNASAPAVQHLLDLTANFIQTNGNDLSKFVEYIDEQLKKSVPLPETGQAVRIMTIHKAKGLQFPVVIYAFAMESTFHSGNRNRMLWVDNSEEMNIEDLPVLLLPFRDQLTITPFSAVFEKERNALLQDLANVVYVALTRPVSRLYVVSSPRSRKSGGEEYLYDIFEKYLAQNQLFQSDDQIVFRYGTELIPEVKSNESMEDGTFRLPAWQSYSRQGRIGIRSGRLIPSEGSARQQALARGILFHNLLASITERVDAAKALDDFVNQGLIPEEEHGQWEKDLKELLSMEGVEPFFRKGAAYRTEATIITPDGRQLRPDKVVKFDDQIGVLDFKTGYPKPEHKKQVANYCDLLRAMGHKSVTGYLLYIDERVLITI
jgi:ATP-dependent exoDNAse (exonuclease V) beta subunit